MCKVSGSPPALCGSGVRPNAHPVTWRNWVTRLSGVGRRRDRSANVVVLVQLDADGVRELLLVLGFLQGASAVIDMALAATGRLLSFSSVDDRQIGPERFRLD